MIIILDVGENTLRSSGKDTTFFDRAKKCAAKIISSKIWSKPKDEIALILMGTPETENELNSSLGGYENIVEKCGLKTPNFQMLRTLEMTVDANSDWTGDWL